MKVSFGGQGRIEGFESSFVSEERKVARKTNSAIDRGRENGILIVSWQYEYHAVLLAHPEEHPSVV